MISMEDAEHGVLLDFFEKLDEMVYVSDPESYEILYINQHLRESLGYHTNEEYAGKKML